VIISERSAPFFFIFVFFRCRSRLSTSTSRAKSPHRQSLLSFFFFAKKQEKGKTHKNKVFPHSILLSAPARIVSKQTNTHTHKREEERNKEKGEKRGDDDDDDDENSAKICLDWRV
jgi:hypothetical protein